MRGCTEPLGPEGCSLIPQSKCACKWVYGAQASPRASGVFPAPPLLPSPLTGDDSSSSSFILKRPVPKNFLKFFPKNSNSHSSVLIPTMPLGFLAHPALFWNFCCQTQQHLVCSWLIQYHMPTAWTLVLIRMNEWKNEGFIAYSLSLAEDRNCLMLPLSASQSST